MKTSRLLPVITLLTLFVSCQKQFSFVEDNVVTIDTSVAATYLNVLYGTDSLQDMDIYLPAGRSATSTKVIVMIHGGSWSSGDKSDLTPYVDTLKRRFPGYALFNINYRLAAAPVNLFPTQENDVKAAMEFIYARAAQYSISGKCVLIGVSAGGHLALLQAYKYAGPVVPKVVVSMSGPTDLTDLYNNPTGGNPLISALLASVVGPTPAQNAAIYFSSSPVNYVSASSSPTLLLYGDVDPLVSPSQAVSLKTKLQAAGVVNQYVLYVGSAHVDTWSNAVLYDSFNKIQAFLTANNP